MESGVVGGRRPRPLHGTRFPRRATAEGEREVAQTLSQRLARGHDACFTHSRSVSVFEDGVSPGWVETLAGPLPHG